MNADLGTLLLSFAVVALLMSLMRWVFRPSHPRRGQPDQSPGRDLGLLVPVLEAVPVEHARRAHAVLGAAGIRSSISARRDQRADVLVFGEDLERARAILP